MHVPRRRSVVAAVLATIALATAGTARADSGQPVKGQATPITSAYFLKQVADGNVVLGFAGAHGWTGDFMGTSSIEGQLVQHSNGTLTFHAELVFTGQTPCGFGTVRFDAQGSSPLPGPVTGHVVTNDQADATVAVHANLDISLVLMPQGAYVTYSGDARCG